MYIQIFFRKKFFNKTYKKLSVLLNILHAFYLLNGKITGYFFTLIFMLNLGEVKYRFEEPYRIRVPYRG